MSVGVVDLLEMIDIRKDQPDRRSTASASLRFGIEHLVEKLAVVHLRQRVVKGLLLQLLVLKLKVSSLLLGQLLAQCRLRAGHMCSQCQPDQLFVGLHHQIGRGLSFIKLKEIGVLLPAQLRLVQKFGGLFRSPVQQSSSHSIQAFASLLVGLSAKHISRARGDRRGRQSGEVFMLTLLL
jgi:hypothetical protein